MNNFTKRLLLNAKISEGMKVLDIGCGKGEVSFLAANIVGESGQVFGIDIQEKAIYEARRVSEKSVNQNTTFLLGGIDELVDSLSDFDAVIETYLNNRNLSTRNNH